MSYIQWPLVRTGLHPPVHPSVDYSFLSMAGSQFVWFDEVDTRGSDGRWEAGLAEDLIPEARERLAGLRPDLLGLRLDRPRLMGIVNVTPDSFSDGGDHLRVSDAVASAARMVEAGADILDIGGESTRPGAEVVPDAEETQRVVPVIRAIRAAGIKAVISVDTRKAAVAAPALAAGADMVNDVSALTYDHRMADLVAQSGVPVCLMHAQGDPKTMQDDPTYADVVIEVFEFLRARVRAAEAAGIPKAHIVADPGIGFGKKLPHNLKILQRLSLFHDLGVPLLLGASRKRFIGTIGNAPLAKDRMPGSVAVALHAAAQGAHIIRVHDVAETRQALAMWQAMNNPKGSDHE